jgi:pimeloyl-ACP methyl ester carboxylesterase
MIIRGDGPPLVLIPGIQGRWEWMRPAVDALARRHRVLTFSLNDADGDGVFERWAAHVEALLDRAGADRAAVVGVSFGGLIAARFAARYRDRVAALVLVSTPAPRWQLDPQTAGYVRRPRLSLPLFAMRGAQRMAPELVAALPTWRGRASFAARHTLQVLRAPGSPSRMAAWVREWSDLDIAADWRAIGAPTLVLTGEPRLDRVVPVSSSLEYIKLIAGARHVVLPETGHLGLILKPAEFAQIVADFCEDGVRS